MPKHVHFPSAVPATGFVLVKIHPVLATTKSAPMFHYDVSYPPSTITPNVPTFAPHVYNDLATTPPVPSMVIRCPHLPWKITILPTNTKHVTVRDVFDGIYRSLRLMALKAEFECLPSPEAKNKVNNAYVGRYKRIDDSETRQHEKTKGLKRVDFLGEHTIFTGLSSTTEGPHVWLLSMTSSVSLP